MNFSGSTKKVSNAGIRQSIVFIGDSITYGDASVPDQRYTFTYKIQQYINTKFGFSPARWGGGFMGTGGLEAYEIGSRNIMIDDTQNFTGQFSEGPLLATSGQMFSATFGMYPYSASTGISGRTVGVNGWDSGAITLGDSPSGTISFKAIYPGTTGYLIMGMMGAGQYQVLVNGSVVGGSRPIGAKFTARATAGSTVLDQIFPFYNFDGFTGNNLVGKNLYDIYNSLASPYGDAPRNIVAVTDGGTSTITMNTPSPVSGNYTFYALEGLTKTVVVGPFTTTGSSTFDTIQIKGIEFVPVVTMLHPTPLYPTTHTLVQNNSRNGYRLTDYSSIPGYPFSDSQDVAAKQIMATVIHSEEYISSGVTTRPVYVLSIGINDIPSSTVADYKSNLKRLASALQNTNYRNYGRVILTVPMNPIPGRTNFYLYRKAVIEVAKELNCSYVDLARLNLQSSDYADGLHPLDSGATKIANYYINMLGL